MSINQDCGEDTVSIGPLVMTTDGRWFGTRLTPCGPLHAAPETARANSEAIRHPRLRCSRRRKTRKPDAIGRGPVTLGYLRICTAARREVTGARTRRGAGDMLDARAREGCPDFESFQMSPSTKSNRPWQSARVQSHGSKPV